MNLRTTRDIKQAVLKRCGEQEDGTSPFDTRVLEYINEAYQAVIAGGSEWGPEVADPWIWAQRKEPVILVLKPAFSTGTVTLTKGSDAGTFSVAPTESLEGYFLRIEGRYEYFRIARHVASETSFELDSEYTEDSGTLNFKAIPLEYRVSDNRILVTNRNKYLDFDEGSGTLSIVLTEGSYTPSSFATELQTQLNTVGAQTYTVTFDEITRKFSFTTDGGSFVFLFSSGPNVEKSAHALVGYGVTDTNVIAVNKSPYVLNAIQRLVAPITVYKDRNAYVKSEKDQGKITGLTLEAFEDSHPLTLLEEGVPTRFAITEERTDGTLTIRFNRYVSSETRVEIRIIPVPFDLQDNTVSVPLIPRPFRAFLVYAASQLLMQDKSDSRVQEQFQLAQQKLKAMLNDNRSETKQISKDFGRLIPRRDQIKVRRNYVR